MSLVRDFHTRYGEPAPDYPPLVPNPDEVRRRGRLVREQYEALGAALAVLARAKDPQKVPDLLRRVLHATAALCYVSEGTAISLGLPFEGAFEEIHRSNMTLTLSDGRTVKGPSFSEPDLSLLVPDHITVDCEEAPAP
jgi:predicted HAD superfamily Cof-like phosphohydrolase